ncbi:hypothetical protein EVAR_85644_1 [Eumeta japonica]|uniref:Uncharacterized protein n=1 Tax=Eumeta variegata TaxID=151549 RepID=A0A4C1XW94_EUMVA|nr:hypothetical protein EVAR_85644_1 [Eumeta japonica]
MPISYILSRITVPRCGRPSGARSAAAQLVIHPARASGAHRCAVNAKAISDRGRGRPRARRHASEWSLITFFVHNCGLLITHRYLQNPGRTETRAEQVRSRVRGGAGGTLVQRPTRAGVGRAGSCATT